MTASSASIEFLRPNPTEGAMTLVVDAEGYLNNWKGSVAVRNEQGGVQLTTKEVGFSMHPTHPIFDWSNPGTKKSTLSSYVIPAIKLTISTVGKEGEKRHRGEFLHRGKLKTSFVIPFDEMLNTSLSISDLSMLGPNFDGKRVVMINTKIYPASALITSINRLFLLRVKELELPQEIFIKPNCETIILKSNPLTESLGKQEQLYTVIITATHTPKNDKIKNLVNDYLSIRALQPCSEIRDRRRSSIKAQLDEEVHQMPESEKSGLCIARHYNTTDRRTAILAEDFLLLPPSVAAQPFPGGFFRSNSNCINSTQTKDNNQEFIELLNYCRTQGPFEYIEGSVPNTIPSSDQSLLLPQSSQREDSSNQSQKRRRLEVSKPQMIPQYDNNAPLPNQQTAAGLLSTSVSQDVFNPYVTTFPVMTKEEQQNLRAIQAAFLEGSNDAF